MSRALSALAVLLLLCAAVQAAPVLLWDPARSSGANLGGPGPWGLSYTYWYNGTSDIAWVSGDDAWFDGTSGTVALQGPQTAGNLTFATPGYTIAGGTLTLTGGSITTAQDATILSPLAGTAGISKLGAGILTLSGSSPYTGNTTIGAGTLTIGPGGRLSSGSYSGAINIASGAALNLRNVSQTLSGPISGMGSLAITPTSYCTIILTGSNSYSGSTTVSAGTLQIGNGGSGECLASPTVVDNGGLMFDHADSLTYAGVISGSGVLMKYGSGLLTLTGSNSYGGATIIGGGTLQIANGGFLGFGPMYSGAISFASGAGLVYNSTASQSFTGVISGPGKLVDAGPGKLTMSGSMSYSGGTVVSGGMLVANNSNGSATGTGTVTLNGGTLAAGVLSGAISGLVQAGSGPNTIAPGAAVAPSYGTLNLNGGLNANAYTTLWFNLNLTTPITGNTYGGDLLKLNGGLSGSGSITFAANPTRLGYYRLMGGTISSATLSNFTLPLAPSGETYLLSSTVDPGYVDLVLSGTGTVPTFYNLSAAASPGTIHTGGSSIVTATITNGGISPSDLLDYAGVGLNATGGTLSGTGLPLSGGSLATGASNSGSQTFFAAAAGVFTLTPTAVSATNSTLGGAAGVGAITGVTVNVFSGNASWTGGSASWSSSANWTDTVSSSVHAAPGTFSGFANTDTAAFTTGGGSVSLNGATPGLAGITFSTASTGAYSIVPGSGGTLTLNNGAGTASVTVASGSHTIAVPVVLGSDLTIAPVSGSRLTISGPISGVGRSLTETGGGLLVLSGTNSFSGGTTISAGTLQLGDGLLATGFLGGDIADNSTLVFACSAEQSFTGTISGTGQVLKQSAGMLTLNGNNTYSGGTILSAGSLNWKNGSAFGSGLLTIKGGALVNTSGTALMNLNNNPQVWANNFTFAGGNDLDLGTGAVSLGGTQTVTVSANTLTVGGSITGSGKLMKAGVGALTLSGSNTYSGGTTVMAGLLNVNNPAALGSGLLTITSGTLGNTSGAPVVNANNNNQSWADSVSFAGSNDLDLGTGAVSLGGTQTVNIYSNTLTLDGPISGTGSLIKIGTGTWALAASNSYFGSVAVNAGKLLVGGSLPAPVTVNSGGILGGTGSLGNVIVNSGGHLSPGNSPGALTLTGSLTLMQGSIYDCELGTPVLSDTISMPAATLTLNGQQFSDINFTPLTGFGPGTYTLIDAGTIYGSLGANVNGTIGGYGASLAVQGNDLVLNVVPEPSTIALLAAGIAGIIVFKRRSRRSALL